MTDQKYKAIHNKQNLPCVDGVGDGFGYYAHTLWPQYTFESMREAERAAGLATIAYKEGYKQAQRDIKNALGV